jgi:hypothetical protein
MSGQSLALTYSEITGRPKCTGCGGEFPAGLPYGGTCCLCHTRIQAKREADERIRDAAPDLLASLKDVFTYYVMTNPLRNHDPRYSGVAQAADAAIRKAKGTR